MRIAYSDDEEFAGQFMLWQANCRRSMAGKKGQAALRDLERALLALPEKRLLHGTLVDDSGGVCALACYAKYKGVDLAKFDREYDNEDVGIAAGMPRLVAWKVVELNDVDLDSLYVASENRYRPYTPDERYERVLTWVRAQIKAGQP